MRNRFMIGTAAFLLASANLAWAQQKPLPQQEQQSGSTVSATTTGGSVEIGGRFTSTDGDAARYERYRDLRNGANVNLVYGKVTENWIFNANVQNAGYRDQRYNAGFSSRRVKFAVFFDQIPLNYSYDARTPFNCQAGICTLDSATRALVQAGGYGLSTPQTRADLQRGSIYNAIAQQIDLQSRRDTIAGSAIISATDNLDFTFNVNSFSRTGNQPWGASQAFSYETEVPLVIDNRTTDVSAGVEWAGHQGMIRLAYDYSKFNQNIPVFTWDNPLRATNYNLNLTTLTGYDPSGYSNGNGAAQGRESMPPTNTLTTVNWLGMVKLPNRTTVNASFAMGASRQDEALIPWTINPVIANPTVYRLFHGLAELPRDTAQMKVNYATGTFNFNSRPNKYVTLSARYRFNSRSDFHPLFAGEEYVRLDAVPEETGGESEQLQINRNTLDANVAFAPFPYGSIRVGYGYDLYEHTIRATEGLKTNTARVSFDTTGNEYVTLRALYEHSTRDTVDLSVERLEEMAMQPAARFFDEAARNRNRATFIVDLNPTSSVGVNFTASTAKDDYQGADAAQQFGLLDNKNTSINVGVSVSPSDKVAFGANYGQETFNGLQRTRNANPFTPGAAYQSWTDPNRNWELNNDEKVRTFDLYLNLTKALSNTDIRLAYDYNDSDNAFVHSGPRITAMQTNRILTPGDTAPCAAGLTSCFQALPNVTNKWQRATVDLRYDVTKQVGIGFGYWFEKLDVADYATINSTGSVTLPVLGAATDIPRIDYLGVLSLGYGNRPYTGSTGTVRLLFHF